MAGSNPAPSQIQEVLMVIEIGIEEDAMRYLAYLGWVPAGYDAIAATEIEEIYDGPFF